MAQRFLPATLFIVPGSDPARPSPGARLHFYAESDTARASELSVLNPATLQPLAGGYVTNSLGVGPDVILSGSTLGTDDEKVWCKDDVTPDPMPLRLPLLKSEVVSDDEALALIRTETANLAPKTVTDALAQNKADKTVTDALARDKADKTTVAEDLGLKADKTVTNAIQTTANEALTTAQAAAPASHTHALADMSGQITAGQLPAAPPAGWGGGTGGLTEQQVTTLIGQTQPASHTHALADMSGQITAGQLPASPPAGWGAGTGGGMDAAAIITLIGAVFRETQAEAEAAAAQYGVRAYWADPTGTSTVDRVAPVITAPAAWPTGMSVGKAIDPVTGISANEPVAWSATGLPQGLSINASTSAISGTPTKSGLGTATIRGTDPSGNYAEITWEWSVDVQAMTWTTRFSDSFSNSAMTEAQLTSTPADNALGGNLQVTPTVTKFGAANTKGELATTTTNGQFTTTVPYGKGLHRTALGSETNDAIAVYGGLPIGARAVEFTVTVGFNSNTNKMDSDFGVYSHYAGTDSYAGVHVNPDGRAALADGPGAAYAYSSNINYGTGQRFRVETRVEGDEIVTQVFRPGVANSMRSVRVPATGIATADAMAIHFRAGTRGGIGSLDDLVVYEGTPA